MKTSSATSLDLVEGGKPATEQNARPSFENVIRDELNDALQTISDDYLTEKRSETATRKIRLDIEINKRTDDPIYNIVCRTKLTLPPISKICVHHGDLGQMRLFE